MIFTGILWMALAGFAADSSGSSSCDAVVLYRSGSEAYQEAVAGVREVVGRGSYRVEFVDQATAAGKTCLDAAPKLVVTLGIGAWEAVGTSSRVPNLLPSMVLRSDLPRDLKAETGHRVDPIYVDVSLNTIAERLHTAFAGRSRLALIHRSSRTPPDAAAIARVKQMGFELFIVDCPGPEKLLAVFSSLKGKVDFVITEPDGDLYNSTTLKPLVLASLDLRLPIIGFSAAFVRAGALAGVYPDFREVGRQTGEAALRILAGKGARGEESQQMVFIAVNERIARLLGVEPSDKKEVLTLK